MMKKAVIFDFDYTLGDSTKGIVQSVNYGMKQMGLMERGRGEIVKTIGLSLAKTYEKLTGRADKSEIERFEHYFVEKADEIMVANTVLYDGVADMLEGMQRNKIKTGIVTTKYRYRIDHILCANGVRQLIDIIVGGDDVRHVKPDPEGILSVSQQLGMELGEMLYVGDHVVDAQAAQAAGIDFIAVLTGTAGREDFQKYPHVCIVKEVRQIRAFIE